MAAHVEITPRQRVQRARLGGLTSWANTADPAARTAAARKAALERFERQVDPSGSMDPAERARRAEAARSAYFTRLAFLSSRVRQARAAARKTKTSKTTAPVGGDGP